MSGLLRIDESQAKIMFWLLWGSNLYAVVTYWLRLAKNSCNIDGWGFTEFLINFQGGYVRRGLLGELLHYFCTNTGFTPNQIIIPLSLCCFLGFSILMICIVKNLHFCWLILLTDYGIFGGEIIRKDYMIFLLLFSAIWIHSNIKQHIISSISPLLIIIITLHIHEASFFYCVPVYLLIIFSDKSSAFSFAKKAGQAAFIAITMGALCICKGDKSVSDAIVNSWQAVYPETYSQLAAASISSIGWDSFNTFHFHYKANFIAGTIPCGGFILRPIALMVILFLMVRIGLWHYLNSNVLLIEKFIYISLILLLTLAPMFTVLSCDFRRVAFYWVVSSILALYFLQNRKIFLMDTPVIKRSLARIRSFILKPCEGRIPYLLMLIFSIPYVDNELSSYTTPVLRNFVHLVKKIAEVLV